MGEVYTRISAARSVLELPQPPEDGCRALPRRLEGYKGKWRFRGFNAAIVQLPAEESVEEEPERADHALRREHGREEEDMMTDHLFRGDEGRETEHTRADRVLSTEEGSEEGAMRDCVLKGEEWRETEHARKDRVLRVLEGREEEQTMGEEGSEEEKMEGSLDGRTLKERVVGQAITASEAKAPQLLPSSVGSCEHEHGESSGRRRDASLAVTEDAEESSATGLTAVVEPTGGEAPDVSSATVEVRFVRGMEASQADS